MMKRTLTLAGNTCSICTEDVNTIDSPISEMLLNCGHTFHSECLDKYVASLGSRASLGLRAPICPDCRRPMAPRSMNTDIDADSDAPIIVGGGMPSNAIRPNPTLIIGTNGADTPVTLLIRLSVDEEQMRQFVRDTNNTGGSRDVVFVLDTSGSMHGDRLNGAKDGLKRVVDTLDETTRVSLITFDNHSHIHTRLQVMNVDRKAALKARLDSLYANDGTNILCAIEAGRDMLLARPPAERGISSAVVLLTDGQDSIPMPDRSVAFSRVLNELTLMHAMPIVMGYGDNVDTRLLGLSQMYAHIRTPDAIASTYLNCNGLV